MSIFDEEPKRRKSIFDVIQPFTSGETPSVPKTAHWLDDLINPKAAPAGPADGLMPPEANGGSSPVPPLPKPPAPKAPSQAQAIPKYKPDADLDREWAELERQRAAMPPDVAAARATLQAAYGNRPKMPTRAALRAPGLAELAASVIGVLLDPEHAGQMIALPWQERMRRNEQDYQDSLAVWQDATRAHEERIEAATKFHEIALGDWHAHQKDVQDDIRRVYTERRTRQSRRQALGSQIAKAQLMGDYREVGRLVEIAQSELLMEPEAAQELLLDTRNTQIQGALARQSKGIRDEAERAKRDMIAAMRSGDPAMVEHFGMQAGLSPKAIRPYLQSAEKREAARDRAKPEPGFTPAQRFSVGEKQGFLGIVPEGGLSGPIGTPEYRAGHAIGVKRNKIEESNLRRHTVDQMRRAAARGDVFSLESIVDEAHREGMRFGPEITGSLLRQAKENAIRHMPERKRRMVKLQEIERDLISLRKNLAKFSQQWLDLAGKGYPALTGRKAVDDSTRLDVELAAGQAKERVRGTTAEIARLEAQRKRLLTQQERDY